MCVVSGHGDRCVVGERGNRCVVVDAIAGALRWTR
jgi:hypothetical protein